MSDAVDAESRLLLPDQQPIRARLSGGGALRREIEALLTSAPRHAAMSDLRDLVLLQNASEKPSQAMRLEVWWRLTVRYVLDPAIGEYQAFREAFDRATTSSERGLVLLMMLARTDRFFRETTLECVSPSLIADNVAIPSTVVETAVLRRLHDAGLTWTAHTVDRTHKAVLAALKDLGVLQGSSPKRTVRLRPGAPVAVFATRLARLEGLTDRQALESRWFRLLGLDRARTIDLLYAARRDGALDFRIQADVVEIDLPPQEVA